MNILLDFYSCLISEQCRGAKSCRLEDHKKNRFLIDKHGVHLYMVVDLELLPSISQFESPRTSFDLMTYFAIIVCLRQGL